MAKKVTIELIADYDGKAEETVVFGLDGARDFSRVNRSPRACRLRAHPG
ncbi:Lsr2 dimerization domain-containing protein [Nocardia farcinica]